LCKLLKYHSILGMQRRQPQCTLDTTTFQSQLPTIAIETKICPASIPLSGRIKFDPPSGGTHKPQQRTLGKRCATGETCTLWHMPGALT